MDATVTWAAAEAKARLEPLGRRLTHVERVAARAADLGPSLFGSAADALIAAAYLHDIGYAPELAATGFHPLDGARFVRDSGHTELASLVAHHTGARNEALLRGIEDFLEEFPHQDTLLLRALTYCDLTTGPDGSRTNVDDRVSEICERYGTEHVVSRGILVGYPEFKAIEAEIEGLVDLSESRASSRTGSP